MKKYKELFKLFNKFKKQQIFLCFLICLEILMSIYIPFLMKEMIDLITIKGNYLSIFKIGINIVVITLISVFIGTIKNYYWHKLRLGSINFLRSKMFESALHKKSKYFKLNTIGDILAKIMDDVVIVAQSISIGIPMLFSNVLILVVVLIVMFKLSFKLAVITVLILPFYYITFCFLNKKIRKSSKKEREGYSLVLDSAQEKLVGIDTIKVFGKEKYVLNLFNKELNNHFKFVKQNLFFNNIGQGITGLISSMLPVIILVYGSKLVWKTNLSLGSLIAFYTYLSYIYEPISNLSDFYLGLQTTIGMSDRILKFLKEDKEVVDDKLIDIDEINSIQFKNVNFSYDKDNQVLNDIDFDIVKGDKIAIIGESGSGKSTLISLIMKIYDNFKGNILVNNIDINDISKDSLYKRISIVEQNLFIFSGSIKDNILFGKKYKKEKLENYLDISMFKDVVDSYDDELNHPINEFGNNLSVGQKQRLCICRALVKDFDVLILDEATSALDYKLEHKLINKLDNFVLQNNKILITVSHRPEILSICNKIIDINKVSVEI